MADGRGRSRIIRPVLVLLMPLAVAQLCAQSVLAQINEVELGNDQTLILRDDSVLSTEQLGTGQIYRSGFWVGAALVGETNDTADESPTEVYALGKVGGYWDSMFSNVGLQGHATGEGDGGYGVVGSYGGWVDATAIGIDVPDAWGALGGQVGTATYAVISNGDQFSTTGTLWTTSDARLKRNVENIEGALAAIRRLRPSVYEFRPELRDLGIAVPESSQYGFLAEELGAVLPSLVREVELPLAGAAAAGWKNQGLELQPEEATTYKAIQVLGLIPLLTKAVQELDAKYEAALASAARENQALRARLAALEGGTGGQVTRLAASR